MKTKVGGRMRTVFSMPKMERLTNKSSATIRRWERTGIIPRATYRDAQGRRYYLMEEIESLADLIIDYGLEGTGKKPPKEFIRAVKESWRGYRERTRSN